MTSFSKMKPAEKFATKWAEVADGGELTGAQPTLEHQFDDQRGWRFDFAWPSLRIAVEIDGFGYGHQAQQHMAADNEKANAAVAKGWRVLRYNSRQLGSHGATEEAVREVCRLILAVSESRGATNLACGLR